MIEKLDQLTVLEKAALLSGENVWESRAVERLSIPRRFHADGPHGLRKQTGSSDHLGIAASEPATCFPTSATVASSWDTELAEEVGSAIGREAAAAQVHVLLGPGLNIKRSPLGGRNFEYFSEDPLLSGKLAAAYVRGIQSQGVAATPKHFAVNSQETQRMASDSVLDERTLREIYLRAFEIVVREAHPWALMSAYNLVNGVYAHEHRQLLIDVLRDEWGFDGAVISDWGGANDAVEAVHAGGTLEMPSPGYDSPRQIVAAVAAGELSASDLDDRVGEMLRLIERTEREVAPAVDVEAHHVLARRAAEESIVMLRNDGVLPLAGGTKVAVIGDFAFTPRYQGAGSSQVNPIRVTSAIEALETSELEIVGKARGFRRDGAADAKLLDEALAVARGADAILLHLGLPEIMESEGIDRANLQLPVNQIAALEALSQVAPVVVILSAGGVVETPWLERTAALLHTHLGGQAGAEGAVRVLTGAVNPSGRLAESYLLRLEDHPAADRFPSTERTAEYREGLYVGYRYTETVHAELAFPFGYGLSYTTFEYTDLRADSRSASLTVTNTGERAGAEVVQLYVSPPAGPAYRPATELRGFAKVHLEPGEAREVTLELGTAAFAHADATGAWIVESGEYTITVGSHVRDTRLQARVSVEGVAAPAGAEGAELTLYAAGSVTEVDDGAFTALLGRSLPPPDWPAGPIEINHPFSRLGQARSPLARLAWRIIAWRMRASARKGKPDLNLIFIANMPPRAIAKMTNGMVSMDMVEALLTVINGRHLRGVGRLITAALRNLRANRRTRRALAAAATPEGTH
ncbi:glycoside hydrolase family 3 C-terminal domain-containing protein [Bogoriella caseilytica]|uniref:Exo-alpha-(1->6)-L-arabinopyranosidase n=1 Tax=Bogoriella caseilytica TaxID=56055 RepID=A0A3N2BFR3_9MICO|nr:glycoside hydrolase family 3 C-terminal domain-containing protein [Bogoriella caseilytica]ROR73904.1 beta-glucosidase [Bogoriella caseilytica]